MNNLKNNWPKIELIMIVSWFWVSLIMVFTNVYLYKLVLTERTKNQIMENNIKEIEKAYPNSEVILKLK